MRKFPKLIDLLERHDKKVEEVIKESTEETVENKTQATPPTQNIKPIERLSRGALRRRS